MNKRWILVALMSVALGLSGCNSMPKAPKCTGDYVPVNGSEHYPQEKKS